MAEQFQDQGGAASMSPKPLARWMTSRLMTRLFSESQVTKRRREAEKKRVSDGMPHVVEYFHQLDDGYSQLVAQVLAKFAERYDVELRCHLVIGPQGKNVAEPELLSRLSRYDAHQVADGYGLRFPDHPEALPPALVDKATSILAGLDDPGFVKSVSLVGEALWSGNEHALSELEGTLGAASPDTAKARVIAGTERRKQLKHYSGAMFYYAGEWYWGVDRLYHLENRLRDLGVDRHRNEPLLAPRPEVDLSGMQDDAELTLEFYPSLRSPYTAIVYDRTLQLAKDVGVKLVLRPVLPMVMRGVPATREKGMYIFMDTAREARAAGVPYGNFYDPIGDPVRRAYSLLPWAVEQGRAEEFLSSFLRHAFALGVSTNSDRGLRKVVEAAGLDWGVAQQHLGDTAWEQILEANRLSMYESGLWGVPSFRLRNASGETLLALWGQDRLWVVAREIKRQLTQALDA